MLTYSDRRLFDIEADCYVIPVNCVGVMGAGVAKEFKLREPELFVEYKQLCADKWLRPGGVVRVGGNCIGDKCYFLAATKNHWKDPSRIEWVEDCCKEIVRLSRHEETLAIPKMGCGCGGLDWRSHVKPVYDRVLHARYLSIIVSS